MGCNAPQNVTLTVNHNQDYVQNKQKQNKQKLNESIENTEQILLNAKNIPIPPQNTVFGKEQPLRPFFVAPSQINSQQKQFSMFSNQIINVNKGTQLHIESPIGQIISYNCNFDQVTTIKFCLADEELPLQIINPYKQQTGQQMIIKNEITDMQGVVVVCESKGIITIESSDKPIISLTLYDIE